MHFVRSWPNRVPDGRNHVVDGLDRVVITNCDYGPLRQYVGEDLVVVEWDIAVAQEDLRRFAELASVSPRQVMVAPYRIYADVYGLPADVWAHRHWAGEPAGMSYPQGAYPVTTGDPVCQLFGLGLVYLPRDVLAAWFTDRWAAHFGDVEFSMWHYLHVEHDVPIAWDVHPVHLNYLTSTVVKEYA